MWLAAAVWNSTAVANRHHPYGLLGKKVRACPRFAKGIIWSRRQIWSWFTMSWLLGGICWFFTRVTVPSDRCLSPQQALAWPACPLSQAAVGGRWWGSPPTGCTALLKGLVEASRAEPFIFCVFPWSSPWPLSPIRFVPLVAERCLHGLCWGCWCAFPAAGHSCVNAPPTPKPRCHGDVLSSSFFGGRGGKFKENKYESSYRTTLK